MKSLYIFLAFPFAGICNSKTGEVDEQYREFFEQLKQGIKDRGHRYFLAHERENWGAEYKGPMECVPIDYNGVSQCDFLIAVPGNPISGGVHVELGWASALKKGLHIFVEKNAKYSPVIMGLAALTKVNYYEISKFPSKELLDKIFEVIDRETLKNEKFN